MVEHHLDKRKYDEINILMKDEISQMFYHCHNAAGKEFTSPMSDTVCPL
jgi:hypothetical protein